MRARPLLAACVALSCRAQPSSSPSFANGPVVLVSPETGPSELQRRLAAQAPAPEVPGASARRLAAALDAFEARTPTRRGYLAVDKPLYKPGETIWFRAFDLASATLAPSSEDVVHVELVSPRGATVLDKHVQRQGDTIDNDFALPVGLPGGEYTLRATADALTVERRVIVAAYQAPRIKKKLEFLRKAYGPGDTVSATLELHRATGEALAGKSLVGVVSLDGGELARVPITTDAAGNAFVQFALPTALRKGDGLLTILVDDGGVTESVQKRIPITLADLTVQVFPEGGDLVANLPGRVYVRATNALGKPADIEGTVVDDRGATVALVRSYHDGMGRFELVPDPARTYKIAITRPAGIATTYPLPAAKRDGCSLQAIDDVTSARADLRVAVWCTRDREVVTAGVLRDRRVATVRTRVAASAPSVIALPMPEAAQGAVRVTLFDDQLAPLAERLVYRKRGADLTIRLTPDKPTYLPRDRVSLAVEARLPDGRPAAAADLAVAVVDDSVLAFADDKQATLLARLYLEAELPGQKIEEPNFYFGSDPKAPAALDLVLGTHGWRRFDWTPVLAAPPEKPIEESWAYTGDLGPARKAHPVRRGTPAAAKRAADGAEPAIEEPEGEEAIAPAPPRVARAEAAQAPAPDADEEADEARPVRRRGGEDEDGAADDDDPAMGAAAPMAMDMERMPGELAAVHGGLVFDDRGFEIGVERRYRHVPIREVVRAAGPAEDDRYCCIAPRREFPQPTYEPGYTGPRTDFRETLAWQPAVRTDASGQATVTFFLSDEVTSFRAIAEGIAGGVLGRGEALVQAKKPVSLAVKLPLEVTSGDRVRLPVTIANETDRPITATLAATFGPAFALAGGALPPTLTLAPNERRSTFYELDVGGDGAAADAGAITIAVTAANLRDEVHQTIPVAPLGFPQQISLSGTLEGNGAPVRREVVIGDVLPGSMSGVVTLYPTALATMVEGTEALLAEPGGCFEQASSTNYPNIMILGYLEEHRAVQPAIAAKASTALEHGYKLLAGYESDSRGYEWFGGDPGHEALSAYGLMEFVDMKKVYGSVDDDMVARTRSWLRGRRDGTGGYQRSERALDSFGRASPEVTDGYITFALTESGAKDLGVEVARQAKVAVTTRDPYLMALATKSLVNAQPKDPTTASALARLAAMQSSDGAFHGADHSITRSGGEALDIETTAIATLALLADRAYMPQVRSAVAWMNAHRSGFGGYGSTQSTVLALKAMTQYAKATRSTEAEGTLILRVDGKEVQRIHYEKGHEGAIELPLGAHLHPGKNVFELELESAAPLPYSGLVTWRSKLPASHPQTRVALATTLRAASAKLGEGVRMDVRITNPTSAGLPMTLARIGLPGNLTFQTWQLQELRDKGLIDFYETRPREVILYFRALAPNAVRDVPLELLASVPGTFTAPPSRAYLYYTAEHKVWVPPTTLRVTP